ncbi:GNAT family N-acetyltransferase [Marinobacter xestospongiae]|uniref:GNAT family N-acetyltransferase n=1 Tax=Marinobacter xestospongiae TaxID=994319 RepID=A0ABU3W2I9_9GAMM|nr:GNAT family N-acetyltransferase [Marinobacter xestospongiae]MDV2080749.1 GNAT family N-acetyltransferase [Marinobacter xestospongiae]
MKLECLSASHHASLLRFELDNRAWFERFIEPRPEAFYSDNGILAHIDEYHRAFQSGELFPGLLIAQGEILGRFNLRQISLSERSATLGYRLAQVHTGKGLATRGVALMQTHARDILGLTTLKAQVLDNNPASLRVLRKRGFQPATYHPQAATIGNTVCGRTEMFWQSANSSG